MRLKREGGCMWVEFTVITNPFSESVTETNHRVDGPPFQVKGIYTGCSDWVRHTSGLTWRLPKLQRGWAPWQPDSPCSCLWLSSPSALQQVRQAPHTHTCTERNTKKTPACKHISVCVCFRTSSSGLLYKVTFEQQKQEVSLYAGRVLLPAGHFDRLPPRRYYVGDDTLCRVQFPVQPCWRAFQQ